MSENGPLALSFPLGSLCPATAWGSQEDLGGNPHLLTWRRLTPQGALWRGAPARVIGTLWLQSQRVGLQTAWRPGSAHPGVNQAAWSQGLFTHRCSTKETEAGHTDPGRSGREKGREKENGHAKLWPSKKCHRFFVLFYFVFLLNFSNVD